MNQSKGWWLNGREMECLGKSKYGLRSMYKRQLFPVVPEKWIGDSARGSEGSSFWWRGTEDK